jgi:hypothetical protein
MGTMMMVEVLMIIEIVMMTWFKLEWLPRRRNINIKFLNVCRDSIRRPILLSNRNFDKTVVIGIEDLFKQ